MWNGWSDLVRPGVGIFKWFGVASGAIVTERLLQCHDIGSSVRIDLLILVPNTQSCTHSLYRRSYFQALLRLPCFNFVFCFHYFFIFTSILVCTEVQQSHFRSALYNTNPLRPPPPRQTRQPQTASPLTPPSRRSAVRPPTGSNRTPLADSQLPSLAVLAAVGLRWTPSPSW